MLLGTGDAILAECSPTDKKWGIGIDIKDPARMDTSKWEGKNMLGRILMEVRDRQQKRRRREGRRTAPGEDADTVNA